MHIHTHMMKDFWTCSKHNANDDCGRKEHSLETQHSLMMGREDNLCQEMGLNIIMLFPSIYPQFFPVGRIVCRRREEMTGNGAAAARSSILPFFFLPPPPAYTSAEMISFVYQIRRAKVLHICTPLLTPQSA